MSTTPQGRAARRANGHKPKKTATLLAQRLVGEIADGGLQPGAALLPEREMLEAYGVARGTLREALRFLEMQGVITIRTGPGGGPVVNAPGSSHLASIIAMMLQLEGAPFGSVLEARATLEPGMARRAAARRTPEQLERIHESVRRMEADLHDAEVFLAENETFHTEVGQAAGNEVFSMVLGSLNWIVDGTVLGVEYSDVQRASVAREHRRIYQAIAAGDGERAAAAMAVHMHDYGTYLERFYPQAIDAPIRWDSLT
ncbi:FadR/GntR family transcriptional regulator [Patulibacter sp.]|uniref:FadR/GntR family transcriptional regulator n=1 Tax=Patulibacter sp. TaxID=1912859 RepID=UPI0027262642|nr:FCD domain-containing protein [Patulibacter sp.]MDO9407720.1 FCD domain-containing protein [Patulibacter sp.]